MERINIREVDETMEFLRSYVSRAPVAHTSFRQASASSTAVVASSPSEHRLPTSGFPLHSDVASLIQSRSSFGSPTTSQPQFAAFNSPTVSSTSATAEQKYQFMAVLSFLRKRYLPAPILETPTTHSDNFSNSLGSVSDADVSTMLDAFCREARGVLHKERTWQSQLRDGSSKRVNFPPADLLHHSVSHPKSPPPSPRSNVREKKTKDSATTSDDDDDDGAAETHPKPVRSKRRALKESMKMMRTGEGVVKFSTSGKPQRRCLRVEDRRTRSSAGETVTVPHLCWSESASTEPSATGQLSLLTIHAVQYKKLSGAVQRDRAGVIRDDIGEAVAAECCISLSFERRGSLDIVFRSAELAKKWCDALQLVIDKNAKLKSKGELE
ncbi:Hypothetical protein, putative [Bodo saltans]|uniref:PH-like domain-containing protein n=1 Tax=Bodo saltans TaxID=75058 RepID=A0A0S4JRK8_BODSA|nr:Hypothetical protein, putative [Bodo saltans]|eukprot:CUG93408.1 Hypothetical protein, putative [Bodo saltans]